MRRLIFGVLTVALAGLASAAEWPQFRGPGGNSFSQEKDLPVKWSKTDGLRYKVDLPGRGLSNPVIASGRIFLTACSGYRERRLHVLCLEEATGKKLWERQFTATGNTACHPMTNMAAPTPVTDGKMVYALFATGDLAALDRDGTLLWYRSLVSDYPNVTNQVGMASSPVLADGVLIVPMDNAVDSFVAGIDVKTGKNIWKQKRDRSINWATPLVLTLGGKPAVLYQGSSGAKAYDPKTGKKLWQYKGGLSTIPSSAQGGGMVYLTGGEIKAVKVEAGKDDPKPAWSAKLGGGFASPVYHDGKLYGLATAGVTCLNAKNGEEVWKQRATGTFDASPIVADGKLYAVTRKGQTYVIRLGDKPELLSKNDLEDTIQATPAVANGCIYLRSDKHLYCIGSAKK